MRRRRTLFTIAAALLLTLPCLGGDLELTWFSIDGGGGRGEGGGLQVDGAIGQPDVGISSGDGFTVIGGFYAAVSDQQPTCDGDIDGSGSVDVTDLVDVILAWGPCDDPPCPADVNGDGQIDVQDLVDVLLAWGPCS